MTTENVKSPFKINLNANLNSQTESAFDEAVHNTNFYKNKSKDQILSTGIGELPLPDYVLDSEEAITYRTSKFVQQMENEVEELEEADNASISNTEEESEKELALFRKLSCNKNIPPGNSVKKFINSNEYSRIIRSGSNTITCNNAGNISDEDAKFEEHKNKVKEIEINNNTEELINYNRDNLHKSYKPNSPNELHNLDPNVNMFNLNNMNNINSETAFINKQLTFTNSNNNNFTPNQTIYPNEYNNTNTPPISMCNYYQHNQVPPYNSFYPTINQPFNPLQQECIQMKVKLTNIENENIAIIEKLKESTYRKNRSDEIDRLKAMLEVINKENIELKKKLLIGEQSRFVLDNQIQDMENIKKELDISDNMITRLNQDNMNIKIEIETANKENRMMKKLMNKRENENICLKEQIEELEQEKNCIVNKYSTEVSNFKRLKEEFDKLNKKYQTIKGKNKTLMNFYGNLKNDNIILNQEVEDMNKKIISNLVITSKESKKEKCAIDNNNIIAIVKERMKKMGIREDTIYDDNSNDKDEFQENTKKEDESHIDCIPFNQRFNISPSKYNIQDKSYNYFKSKSKEYSQFTIKDIDIKLSELNHEKIKLENNLFAIPEKNKSLNQINRKRMLDDKIKIIEIEISNYKSIIRNYL